MVTPNSRKRVLIFSHDSFGLGHFRRCQLIAAGLTAADPDVDCLIITGSPRAQAYSLPERVDCIKLPAATKSGDGAYQARKLRIGLDELVDLRSQITLATATNYRPHVILVDHAPLGIASELGPLLGYAEMTGTRLVLGMRDIIDQASSVDQTWTDSGMWQRLERYDEVLVYGDPSLPTTCAELNLQERIGTPVTHVGYIAPARPDPRSGDRPYFLVTAGGGGDGHPLVRRVLDLVEQGALAGPDQPDVHIVTGPLLAKRRQAELISRAESLSGVTVETFRPDMRTLLASAAGVISMAGYNTVVELLVSQVPAVLVPRTEFRAEQRLRAERIAARVDRIACRTVEQLDAQTLRGLADRPATGAVPLDLGGVARTARILNPPAHDQAPVESAMTKAVPGAVAP